MRAPFLMVLLGSPSRGWLGVAPTSSGDLDELQPISLNTERSGSKITVVGGTELGTDRVAEELNTHHKRLVRVPCDRLTSFANR